MGYTWPQQTSSTSYRTSFGLRPAIRDCHDKIGSVPVRPRLRCARRYPLIDSSTGAPAIMGDSAALDDLRGQALQRILVVIFILGWVMTFVSVRSDLLTSWLPALALLLSAPASYALVGRHYRLSAWVMIAGVEIALFLLARS